MSTVTETDQPDEDQPDVLSPAAAKAEGKHRPRLTPRTSSPLTPAGFAALARLAAAATPGPWEDCIFAGDYAAAPDERGVHVPGAAEAYTKPDGTWHALHICRGMTGPNRAANAAYIAAACNAVPQLLAELDDAVRRLAQPPAYGPALREDLAALEHARWAHWMDYLFSVGTFNPDGTWTMPAEKVQRWQRQAATPYAALSEAEKDSDRAEVAKTLQLLGMEAA